MDLEGVLALKVFLNSLGCSNLNYQFNLNSFFDFRFCFLLNSTIVELEEISYCFFLGLNLRVESPILNSRLRKSFLKNDNFLLSFSFGLSVDYLSFPVINFGNNLKVLKKILESKFAFQSFFFINDFVCLKLLNYNFNICDSFSFFLGDSILQRFDSNFYFFFFKSFSFFYSNNNFCRLHIVSSYLGKISGFEVGALPGINYCSFKDNKRFCFLYLLGTDNFNFNSNDDCFFIYQGSFMDSYLLLNISLFFPVSIYVEKVSMYLNIEGRLRFTKRAISPFKLVYTDLDVIKSFFFFRNSIFTFNFFFRDFLRLSFFFKHLIDYCCLFFEKIELYNKSYFKDKIFFYDYNFFLLNFSIRTYRLANGILPCFFSNYYNFDIFSKNSRIMSLCHLKAGVSNFSTKIFY